MPNKNRKKGRANLTKSRLDLKGKKIVSAPTDKIAEAGALVDRILDAVGHPEAYVTDESMVSDFFEIGLDKKGRSRELARIRGLLGVQLSAGDYLFELALRMRANRKEA